MVCPIFTWKNVHANPPRRAGYYIVGNLSKGKVTMARYKPRKGEWVFLSAAMAFEVDVWGELPSLPIA